MPWRDDYEAFTRPRLSERKFMIVCLILICVSFIGLCFIPGGPPEPGFKATHHASNTP